MQVLISAFRSDRSLEENLIDHKTLVRYLEREYGLTEEIETVQLVVGDSRSHGSAKTLAILVNRVDLDQALNFNKIADRYDQDSWYLIDSVMNSAFAMKVTVKTGSRTVIGNISQADRRTALYSDLHIKRADGTYLSVEKASA